jgi:hypothetical protein
MLQFSLSLSREQNSITDSVHVHDLLYRVSQKEMSIFWEVIVSVILSK